MKLVLATAWVALALSWAGCSQKKSAVPQEQVFDQVITPEIISAACRMSERFAFHIDNRNNERQYLAEFVIEPKTESTFALCRITVQPGGTKLSDAAYETYKKQIDGIKQNSGDGKLPGYDLFLALGHRAVRFAFISPNGGGDGIVFTTSDRVYDVTVSQENHLETGTINPGIDCETLARTISSRYDRSRPAQDNGLAR